MAESSPFDRVVVVEPDFAGHKLGFARIAVSICRVASREVTFATSQLAIDAADLDFELGGVSDLLVDGCLSHSASVIDRIRDVWRLSGRHEGRFVYLNADEYLVPLALVTLLRPQRGSGILMRPPVSRRPTDRLKRLAIAFLRHRSFDILPLVSPLGDQAPGGGGLVDPDGLIAPEADEQGVALGELIGAWRSEAGPPVLAVVGTLSRRKALDVVLSASAAGVCRALLVGDPGDAEFAGEIRSLAALARPRSCMMILRRVTEFELDVAISMADCVALLYSNEVGSSGITARCWRLRRPVVGWRNQTVRQAIDRHGMGTVVAALDVDSLKSAMSAAVHATTEDMPRVDFLPSWQRLVLGGP